MTMPCQDKEKTLREAASAAGQDHVFKYWDQLDDSQKDKLLKSLDKIEFDRVKPNFDSVMNVDANGDKIMAPVEDSNCAYVTKTSEEKMKEWYDIGMKAMANNEVAVLLLAGGQGTRLGSADPKGMYNVDLPSQKSLFQIQSERIKRLQTLNNCEIPFYIMTSEPTYDKTKGFFESNNFFGLKAENVFFFNQNTLPCLDFEGKVMMKSKFEASEAPDGNGGLYKALKTSGAIDDMKKRKIKHVHAYCVDNVLVRVADPWFIGFSIASNVESTVKVIPKNEPTESVGVVCKINNKFGVIEYSEISKENAHAKNPNGTLLYDAANICNHYFKFDFLERVSKECQLPFHIAKKKIPTLDNEGNSFTPKEPNGIKLEMFIFDVLEFSSDLAVLYCERETDFSPLKNANGAKDSTPEHCKNDLMNYCRAMLVKAGADVTEGISCEVSPLTSYGGEGLEKYKGQKLSEPINI